jgi:hypothetical protein
MGSSADMLLYIANIHDSQMFPRLLDPENENEYVWTDSAYSSECF